MLQKVGSIERPTDVLLVLVPFKGCVTPALFRTFWPLQKMNVNDILRTEAALHTVCIVYSNTLEASFFSQAFYKLPLTSYNAVFTDLFTNPVIRLTITILSTLLNVAVNAMFK